MGRQNQSHEGGQTVHGGTRQRLVVPPPKLFGHDAIGPLAAEGVGGKVEVEGEKEDRFAFLAGPGSESVASIVGFRIG